MTTPTGWLCPSCGKAHGPTVQTCPDAGTHVNIVNTAPNDIVVKSSERETDLGKVIEIHVARALARGRPDRAFGARYGAVRRA